MSIIPSPMSSNSSSSTVEDRLTGLLTQFAVSAEMLDADAVLRFPRWYGDGGAGAGAGHLHVLWSGTLQVVPADGAPAPQEQAVVGPAVLLHAAGERHQLVPIERPLVTCAAVRFAHGAGHPLVRALPSALVVPTATVDGLGPTLQALFGEVDHVRCGRPLVAGRLLEVVVLQLLRWAFTHPQLADIPAGLVRGMGDPSIARALVAIHDAPGDAWTLDRMARASALSRSAFAERFRRLVGTTPAAYVATYRMAVVKDRLLAGASVGALAVDLGYANGSGLSRAFAAEVGMSPTAWLASQRPAAEPIGRSVLPTSPGDAATS